MRVQFIVAQGEQRLRLRSRTFYSDSPAISFLSNYQVPLDVA